MSLDRGRVTGLILLTASILLSSIGQLGMKVGMQELHASVEAFGAVQQLFSAPVAWVAGGLFAYALSMLAWLAVLVRYPLSFAYPMLSLSYVLVYLGATQWDRLLEPATPMRTTGTLLILAGVALVSISERRQRQ